MTNTKTQHFSHYFKIIGFSAFTVLISACTDDAEIGGQVLGAETGEPFLSASGFSRSLGVGECLEDVGCFAGRSGINRSRTDLRARANFIETGAGVGLEPTGTTNYSGEYAVAYSDDDFSQVFTSRDSGAFSMALNPETGNFIGSGENLSVIGNYEGGSISGDSFFFGVHGEFSGAAGQNGVVGAVAGESRDFVYGGGFVGAPE